MTDQDSTNHHVGPNIGAGEPGRDWLGFGVGAEFQPSRAAEWLARGTEDLARLAGADTAAGPVRKHSIEVAAMCNPVAEIFDSDIALAQNFSRSQSSGAEMSVTSHAGADR